MTNGYRPWDLRPWSRAAENRTLKSWPSRLEVRLRSAPAGRGSEVEQWAAKRQLYVDNLKVIRLPR